MKYVNLTDKTIRVAYGDEGNLQFMEIPPSGKRALCEEMRSHWKTLEDGTPVTEISFGDVINLPPPQPGVIYIVSGYTAQMVGSDRDDVVAPDIGPTALRVDGRVYANRGWRVYT